MDQRLLKAYKYIWLYHSYFHAFNSTQKYTAQLNKRCSQWSQNNDRTRKIDHPHKHSSRREAINNSELKHKEEKWKNRKKGKYEFWSRFLRAAWAFLAAPSAISSNAEETCPTPGLSARLLSQSDPGDTPRVYQETNITSSRLLFCWMLRQYPCS